MLIPKFSWLDNSALIIDGEYLNALREGMIVFYLMFPLRQFRDILWSCLRGALRLHGMRYPLVLENSTLSFYV